MSERNGPISHWNPLEGRLFESGWPEIKVVTMLSLLGTCNHVSGVFSVSLWQLLGYASAVQKVTDQTVQSAVDSTVRSLDLNANDNAITNAITYAIRGALQITENDIKDGIKMLVDDEHINYYKGNKFWIRDRWSYTKNRTNVNHQIFALKHMDKRFSEIIPDFVEYYDIDLKHPRIVKAIPSLMPLAMPPPMVPPIKEKGNINTNDEGSKQKPKTKSAATIEKSKKYIPLAGQLTKIIKAAQNNIGITRVTNNTPDKSANVLRMIVETDKIPVEDIVPVAIWCFTGNNREFYLKNMTMIAQWRKQWKEGKAFITAYQRWEEAGRPAHGRATRQESQDPAAQIKPGN